MRPASRYLNCNRGRYIFQQSKWGILTEMFMNRHRSSLTFGITTISAILQNYAMLFLKTIASTAPVPFITQTHIPLILIFLWGYFPPLGTFFSFRSNDRRTIVVEEAATEVEKSDVDKVQHNVQWKTGGSRKEGGKRRFVRSAAADRSTFSLRPLIYRHS